MVRRTLHRLPRRQTVKKVHDCAWSVKQLVQRACALILLYTAVCVFCVGVIVQTSAFHPSSIFGGRFVTGLGVGSLSMAVPLYKYVSDYVVRAQT